MNFEDAFISLSQNLPEFKKKIKKNADIENKKVLKYNLKDSEFNCNEKNIKDIPNLTTFNALKSSQLKQNLLDLSFEMPTPIQSYVIPVLLRKKHVLACAPTGSGKTAAYLIPLIENLLKVNITHNSTQISNKIKPFALVIAPTQDLVKQIFHVAIKLAKNTPTPLLMFSILNKSHYADLLNPNKQLKTKNRRNKYLKLHPATKVIISTPYRLASIFSLHETSPLDLKELQYVIIDECDKLVESNIIQQIRESGITNVGLKKNRSKSFDNFIYENEYEVLPENSYMTKSRHQSFRDQMNPIFSALHKVKSSCNECCFALFSATVNEDVNDWLTKQLDYGWDNENKVKVLHINIGSRNATVSTVDQEFRYCATEEGKLFEIQKMLVEGLVYPCLIFLESRERAKDIYQEIVMSDKNLTTEVISGDKSESKRSAIIKKFCEGDINVLICTDLLCRGIDFKMVINYDAPVTKEDYIHRIGRSGRANGTRGSAVTFWTDSDLPHMSSLISVLRASINPKRAHEYDELQRLVDAWLKRRSEKIQKKSMAKNGNWIQSGSFVISNRRRERKLASQVQSVVDSNLIPNKISKMIRPWNPNRKRTKELPGSLVKRLKDAQEDNSK